MEKVVLSLVILIASAFVVEGQFDICSVNTLTDSNGIVVSPNYPSNYGNDLDCSVTINAAPGKVLRVEFLNMDLESHSTCRYDKLQVYDGNALYASRAFCGTELPRTFHAHSSSVRLMFTTDSSITASGFRVQWSSVDACAANSYTCWNGNCVPSSQRCDSIRHCQDGSDEIECTQTVSSNSECGKVSTAPQFLWDLRIVGGNDAPLGTWPWQVRLSVGCGGSIIGADWVVTAAHCTQTSSTITVYAGLENIGLTAGQTVTVSQIIDHPNYSSQTLQNDISLLRLSTSLTFSSTIRPICLPADTATFDIPAGETCIATGWGTLASGFSSPNIMQQVRLPIVSQTSCASQVSSLQDTQICAGDFNNGGVDTCQGDSGGPLVCYIHEAQWFLIGITSFGEGCAQARKPGVYTRVSKFTSWVTGVTGISAAATPDAPATVTFPTTTTTTTTTTTATTVAGNSPSAGQYDICQVSVLTALSGIVTSPNYPNNYPNSQSCTVTISASSGKVIKIDFLNMDIESHSSCIWDSLKVYDGNDLFSSRGFCGTDLPRSFNAHNPTVRLEFVSDSLVTRTGFRVQWTTSDACSGDSYTCWNGNCVPSTQRCDTIRHCQDGSDEMECSQTASSNAECGKVAVPPSFVWDLRVVGGNNAALGNWPWQVRLSVGCGGSIINSEWVVTAAHCTDGDVSGMTVTAGLLDTSQTAGSQTVAVASVTNHPSYVSATLGNDISLLRLSTPLVFSTTVRPICLPDDSATFDIPAGETCIATGWGTLASGFSSPNIMQQVRLPIVDQAQCNSAVSAGVSASQICAGDFTKGGVDTCQGDSGGPLVCYINEAQWFLIGITSFGEGCAQIGNPGVYTRVSKFATWIQQVTSVSSAVIPPTPVTVTFPTTTASSINNDECGSVVLTADQGSISSPGYPQSYTGGLSCQWTIVTNEEKVIEIEVVAFDLESHSSCDYDHLTFYDGTEMVTGVNFCGSTKPQGFAASSTSVRIVFVSDLTVHRTGFLIRWLTVDRCAAGQFACWNGTCVSSDLHCNGVRDCVDDSDEITCAHNPTNNNECGKVTTAPQFTWNHRIVGGNEATSGSWPWQAALLTLSGTTPFCGGSIISTKWILTAAHCVENSTPFFGDPDVKVEVGKHSRVGGATQTSAVSRVFVHSSFTTTTRGSDIALLLLATPITYRSNVRPICIPSLNHEVDSSTMAIATGWGTLRSGGDPPSTLYQVRLPIVSQATCDASYTLYDITSSQVCAGHTTNGGVDTCQGDSGGPLVALVSENTWYLMGVTSYGTGCADASSPGVYTRVSSFKTWIDETMENSGVKLGANRVAVLGPLVAFLVLHRF